MKTYERKINYYETDQMGVVHHSNYIRFFEEARISFMEQVGYTYFRMEQENVISPIVNVSCSYKTPIRYGETIIIEVKLTELGNVRCTFEYVIKDKETNKVRAIGKTESCFVSRDGKIVACQNACPEFYNMFISEVEPNTEK